MALSAGPRNVEPRDGGLGIGWRSDVVTSVAVSAGGRFSVAGRDRPPVYAFLIREERAGRNPASFHYKFFTVTRSAGGSDVCVIDSRPWIARSLDCMSLPVAVDARGRFDVTALNRFGVKSQVVGGGGILMALAAVDLCGRWMGNRFHVRVATRAIEQPVHRIRKPRPAHVKTRRFPRDVPGEIRIVVTADAVGVRHRRRLGVLSSRPTRTRKRLSCPKKHEQKDDREENATLQWATPPSGG